MFAIAAGQRRAAPNRASSAFVALNIIALASSASAAGSGPALSMASATTFSDTLASSTPAPTDWPSRSHVPAARPTRA